MERKSGLGFGFFNKSRAKAKARQRSERQLADMYDKVAIRGSRQHVWGEEVQGHQFEATNQVQQQPHHSEEIRPFGVRAQTMPNHVSQQGHRQADEADRDPIRLEPPIARTSTLGSPDKVINLSPVGKQVICDDDDDDRIASSFRPQTRSDRVQSRPAEVEVEMELGPVMTPRHHTDSPAIEPAPVAFIPQAALRVASPSSLIHRLSFESTLQSPLPPTSTMKKKFSFCPSTISVASQRSPTSAVIRSPRRSSLTAGSNHHPYSSGGSRRSSFLSTSSTPSIVQGVTTVSREASGSRDSDHVSMADEGEEGGEGNDAGGGGRFNTVQLSPANSLQYADSITSRLSSSLDGPGKWEDRALPGSIYATVLPDALRGLGSVDALPMHYDEDEDSSSISGLSEVNADNSDSEFGSDFYEDNENDDDEGGDVFVEHGEAGSMITTGINDKLRRDSVKRVSYTKLENGDYLVAHKRRSQTSRQSSSPRTSLSSTRGGGGLPLSLHSDVAALERSESVRSEGSVWSIEREYISGGI